MLNSTPVGPSPEAISIVVIGAMNPRIHQPHWYAAADIINDDDKRAAIQSLISVPRVTQFAMDNLRITCQDDRWDLLAEGEGAFPKGVSIAVSTWNKLSETPVVSYGFNFFANFSIASGNAGKALCALISPSASKLVASADAAELKIVGSEPGLGQQTVHLRPSDQADESISASINYHFVPDENTDYFDLGSALNSNYSLCFENARSKLAGISSLFNQLVAEN